MAGKKRKKSIFSHLTGAFTALIGIALMLALVLLGLVMFFNAPMQAGGTQDASLERDGIKRGEGGEYYIDIRKGESARSAGLRLERAGLIRSRHFWYLLCRFDKDFIKSGTYRLDIPASQISIHRLLISGKQLLTRVTIPEGATLKKMAKIMEEAGICPAAEFIEAAGGSAAISRYRIPNPTMEGYLFPDTYLFPAEYPAEKALEAMADNFFSRIGKIDQRAPAMPPEELNQKVIIASIVEREYRLPEEAPLMAGVFFNRLRINMALQSCATVEYIITEIQGKPHPAVILSRDLEIRDPYNTYVKPGLPPGPISAPGEVALRAAFFPADTRYLYFRLNDAQSGRHYFSATLDEHIKAGQFFTKGSP
ncbi:MAG: endolytic transglycosylase MltG [Treponema sp.]|jgi:UPF0755 protein|nr:endolytic transglycosylase MltG [Treponema sp.]